MAPLKVLIVDDHELVRRGIRSLLSLAPHTAICGEAGDGLGALMKARTLHPDLYSDTRKGLDAQRTSLAPATPGCASTLHPGL